MRRPRGGGNDGGLFLICDFHHSNSLPQRLSLSSRLAGLIPPPSKLESDMINFNDELNIDDLESVSGGTGSLSDVATHVNAYVAALQ
jgi:hypothetical protein